MTDYVRNCLGCDREFTTADRSSWFHDKRCRRKYRRLSGLGGLDETGPILDKDEKARFKKNFEALEARVQRLRKALSERLRVQS